MHAADRRGIVARGTADADPAAASTSSSGSASFVGSGSFSLRTRAAAKKPSVPCWSGDRRRYGLASICGGTSVAITSRHRSLTGTTENSGCVSRNEAI
jgi:hypothetical protein